MNSQKFRVLSYRDAFRFAFDSLTTQGVSGPDAKTTAEGLFAVLLERRWPNLSYVYRDTATADF